MAKLVLLGKSACVREERFLAANLFRRFTCSSRPDPDARLFLARKSGGYPDGLVFPPGATVIVSSEDENTLRLLARAGAQTIVCGLSSKDTVTFSSRSEDSAVVSLTRTIPGLAGEPLEPMDIPILFPPGIGDYPLLACTAAFLLSGATGTGTLKFFQS